MSTLLVETTNAAVKLAGIEDVQPGVGLVGDSTAILLAELARLKAENERLKVQTQRKLALRVSEKKALAIYGLGRFPVTLYKGQWKRLLAAVPEIQQFLKDHDGELEDKGEGEGEKPAAKG